MKNIFSQLRRLEEYVKGDSSLDRRALFERVKNFVYAGEYSTYKDIKRFLKFEYLPESQLAGKLGVKDSSVRQIRKRVSSEAFAIIGEEFLNTIEFGTDKELKMALREFTFIEKQYRTSDLFFSEFVRLVEDSQYDAGTFSMGDCKYELTLLHWLSLDKIKDLLANVDVTRLDYVLKVLDGKAGTNKDRVNALRVILSDDPVKHAKPEDRSKFTFPPVRPEEEF